MCPVAPADHLRQLVVRTAKRAGLEVRKRGVHSRPELRRAALLADGDFTVVLDVGANRGDYGTQLRQCGYRARIVSFEPLSAPFRRLEATSSQDDLWNCRQVALGTEPATRKINVAANAGASSSFLDMTELHSVDESVRYIGSEQVRVCRLDDLMHELLGPGDRAWLKLDVQGYELEVLKGARNTLAKVDGLEIEMSLVPLYTGQPLIHHVLDLIRTSGYELIDLEPAYRDPASGRVLQLDGIALRRH